MRSIVTFKKSVGFRKGKQYIININRLFYIRKKKLIDLNPLILNSIPKSGTHLISQFFENNLYYNNLGGFISSHPSIKNVVLKDEKLILKLDKILKNEIVLAHLYHTKKIEQLICNENFSKILLIRNPKDLICSYVNYVSKMNKWHRDHKYFKSVTMKQGIKIALNGINNPNGYNLRPFGTELQKYTPWLHSENVLVLRFEDLVLNKTATIERLNDYLIKNNKIKSNINLIDPQSIVIDKTKSHTYTKSGGIQSHKKYFDNEINELFNNKCSGIMAQLGYENQ